MFRNISPVHKSMNFIWNVATFFRLRKLLYMMLVYLSDNF